MGVSLSIRRFRENPHGTSRASFVQFVACDAQCNEIACPFVCVRVCVGCTLPYERNIRCDASYTRHLQFALRLFRNLVDVLLFPMEESEGGEGGGWERKEGRHSSSRSETKSRWVSRRERGFDGFVVHAHCRNPKPSRSIRRVAPPPLVSMPCLEFSAQ